MLEPPKTPKQLNQRTPWGGGKKRGVENLTNDTPPKKGFWTPPHMVRFPPPSGVSALFFLYKNPRQSRPEALLEGSKNFRASAFSGTFSSPHTFCTPPYHGPIKVTEESGKKKAHRHIFSPGDPSGKGAVSRSGGHASKNPRNIEPYCLVKVRLP